MANEQDREKSNVLNNSNILAITAQENATPVAQDDEITGAFSGMLRITPEELLANDNDFDGDTLRGVSIQDAENGTVYWDGTHVVFVGAAGYSGPASFSYTITDDQGGFATATVSLSVIANTPPAVVNDQLNGVMNGAVIIDPETLLANDSDAEGSALEIVGIQDAVNGVVIFNGSKIVFTPDVGYAGPASFSYTVIDDQGATTAATVNLTIEANTSNINTAPDAQDDTLTAEAGRIVFIKPDTLLANDSDIDGDAIAGVSIQDAENGKVIWDGEQVVFVPKDGYIGEASFTYTITDSHGAKDTATVNLTITPYSEAQNSNFRVDTDYIISKTEGEIKIDPLRLLDGDRGEGEWIFNTNVLLNGDRNDGLTIISVQDAVFGEVLLDEAGDIAFTPQAGYQGDAAFTYTVEDTNGDQRTAIVNIDVQSSPAMTIDVGDSDQDFRLSRSNPISITRIIDTQPLNGEVFTSTTASGFGSLTETVYYNPDEGFIGQDSFTYTQRAYSGVYGAVAYTIGTVNLKVIENLPVITVEDQLTGLINAPLITPITRLLSNDIDPEAQSLNLISVQDAVNGDVAIINNNVVFTPASGFTGNASYSYTVQDNRLNTTTQKVSIDLRGAVDAVLSDDSEQNTVAEGTTLTVGLHDEANLLNNASLQAAAVISYRVGDNPKVFTVGEEYFDIAKYFGDSTQYGGDFAHKLIINTDGSYSYETSGDYHGELPTIYYTVHSNGQTVEW